MNSIPRDELPKRGQPRTGTWGPITHLIEHYRSFGPGTTDSGLWKLLLKLLTAWFPHRGQG